MFAADLVLFVVTVLLLVPFGIFWVECTLALFPRPSRTLSQKEPAAEVWVVIPAHNEASVIASTLESVNRYLPSQTSVLVIADNCEDATAQLSLARGCHVIERTNPGLRGKGYALQFAFQYLRAHHDPSVVIILDADCQVGPQTISHISSLAFELNRPVQALNLSTSQTRSSSLSTVSELGFRFKNLIRPLGLLRIGMPCHLMGTGVAIPWQALSMPQSLASDLAEDMQLGVDLAIAGFPTYFYPEVEVSSHLPQNGSGFMTQRTRWEQGHLQTALKKVPILLKQSLLQRRIDLFALGLDLLIPPFSLLMLSWAFVFLVTLFTWQAGASFLPFAFMAVSGGMTALVIFCCWLRYCRTRISFSSLLLLPFYALRKLPIYLSFLSGRGARHWVRTER